MAGTAPAVGEPLSRLVVPRHRELETEIPSPAATAAASRLPYAGVAVIGVALGLSQAIHGAYAESTWSPIALGILALLLAVAIGAPRRPPLAAFPLLGLAAWSIISSAWGDSTSAAWTAGDRWLLYAAALALLVGVIAGERRRAETLLLAVTGGIVLVAGWMVLRMLTNHGAALFLGNRLNNPLGYVNGEAGYLLVAVWPCCALAERVKFAPLAGLAMTALVALVGVGALTRSRSWEFGLAASAVIVVALFPGRRRRLAILPLAAAAIFVIHRRLSEVSAHTVPGNAVVHRAAVAILLVALGAGLVWGVAVWLLERFAPQDTAARTRVGRLATTGLLVVIATVIAAVAVNAPSLAGSVRSEYRDFTHLSGTASTDRFLSGGGNRYDYWRVAWLEFRSQPLHGVGAGNYQPGYYRDRRTTEAIQQPHSLELQTLAELGLVGAALLAAFLAIVAVAVARGASEARRQRLNPSLAMAATGVFVAWLAQTSVDWEHLIPGLTAIALAAAAVLISIVGRPSARPTRRGHAYLVVGAAALAAAGAALVVPRVLTLRAQASAQRALARDDPRGAIGDATRALEYDTSSVPALVLRSAAFARLDAFAPARADLQHALRVEPRNWVTWALLGDLLSRRGEPDAARAAYRHAQALDPLEPSLAEALKPGVPDRT